MGLLDKILSALDNRAGERPTEAGSESIATIGAITESTERLLVQLRRLDDKAVREPSLLPGWTIAHVIAHLTQHADALARCAESLRIGTEAVMYPKGLEARAEAIETASGRSANTLFDDLARSSGTFAAAWTEVPDGYCRSVPDSNPFPTSTVLLRRLREIEVHGADTGLAELAPATWSAAYVGSDLFNQWDTVNRRTSASVHVIDETGRVWRAGDDSAAPIHVSRRDILAWLLDRHSQQSLPRLTTWGDQSRWGR
jgi:maleylpyruvate isomerase